MSILELKDVSIRYMTGDFKDIGLKEYVMRRIKRNYQVKEFWADRDISFALEKGDMLGIILWDEKQAGLFHSQFGGAGYIDIGRGVVGWRRRVS